MSSFTKNRFKNTCSRDGRNSLEYSDMSIFQQPCCLITVSQSGNPEVAKEFLDEISNIKDDIVTIAAVGLYRTGKSYLMNQLHRRIITGFRLGKTVQSETKGIWIWCRIHPSQKNTVMMLLDTEGLGNIEKGDVNFDNKIFTLSMLMSTVLCYNIIGTFDRDAIVKLSMISGIIQNRFSKRSSEFVLCVRDFSLELIKEGKEISEDEYLEHCLENVPGDERAIIQTNIAKTAIKEMFPTRKCFTFDRPVKERKKLQDLQSVPQGQLNESFVNDVNKFKRYIFSRKAKVFYNGEVLNGKLLSSLLVRYVDAICKGEIPDTQDILNRVIEKENEDLVQLTTTKFRETMHDQTNELKHTEDVRKFADETISMLIGDLKRNIKNDSTEKFQNKVETAMLAIKAEAIERNRKRMFGTCYKDIEQLYARGFRRGYQFHSVGGQEAYQRMLKRILNLYMVKWRHLDIDVVESAKKTLLSEKGADEWEIASIEFDLKKKRDQNVIENIKRQRKIQYMKEERELQEYLQTKQEERSRERTEQKRMFNKRYADMVQYMKEERELQECLQTKQEGRSRERTVQIRMFNIWAPDADMDRILRGRYRHQMDDNSSCTLS